jgi:hypothetical protein
MDPKGVTGCAPRSDSDDYMLLSGICREADARLIAAAPELVEALRRVCEASGALDFHTPLGEAIFWADVAVAKAEGRS